MLDIFSSRVKTKSYKGFRGTEGKLIQAALELIIFKAQLGRHKHARHVARRCANCSELYAANVAVSQYIVHCQHWNVSPSRHIITSRIVYYRFIGREVSMCVCVCVEKNVNTVSSGCNDSTNCKIKPHFHYSIVETWNISFQSMIWY